MSDYEALSLGVSVIALAIAVFVWFGQRKLHQRRGVEGAHCAEYKAGASMPWEGKVTLINKGRARPQ